MKTVASLNVARRRLDALVRLPGNPNEMDEKMRSKLERSLTRFGYVDPIVVNVLTNHVVGGNHRLEALLGQGIEEADVVEIEVDEAEEKALSLALNHVHGESVEERLAAFVAAINDASPSLLDLTGLDEDRIDALLKAAEPREAPDAPAEFQEVDVKDTNHACPSCGYKWNGSCKPGEKKES